MKDRLYIMFKTTLDLLRSEVDKKKKVSIVEREMERCMLAEIVYYQILKIFLYTIKIL